jgi:hypothetical protein
VGISLFAVITLAVQPEHAPDPEPEIPPAAAPASVPASPTTPPVPATPEVETEITLQDGRKVTGVLVENSDETITIRVAGIALPFPAEQVSRIRTLLSIEDQYKALRAPVKDLDFMERLKIADWLRTKERFSLSLAEIEGVLALDPDNIDAAQLRSRVLLEKALVDRRVPSAQARKVQKQRSERGVADFPLLSDEQINMLRVFEINFNASPRLSISNETIDRLVDTHGGREGIPSTREGRDAFRRRPPAEIVAAMFRVRARELYPHVKVLDHPPAFRGFRDDVHNAWVLNSCATTACHGGEDSGRLRLANKGTPPDRVMYTNFLILDRHRLADGRPLIDYDRPGESLFLHFALPRSETATPHPEVKSGKQKVGWRSVLAGKGDPRFQKAVRWIESMYRPRPDYPIDYSPPAAKPVTEQPR